MSQKKILKFGIFDSGPTVTKMFMSIQSSTQIL